VRLFFMGLRHPTPVVPEMRMATRARNLADELGITGTHVFFNEGWVAYEERQNYLLEADVGVSTHLDHLETAFSFRTRILDYIWAGLPVVATRGDTFGNLIEAEQLGLTVPPGDVAALEEALFRMLDDGEFAAICRKNLGELRPRYMWSRVLEPLVAFCHRPRKAPDLIAPPDLDDVVVPLGAGGPRLLSGRRIGLLGTTRIAVGHARTGGLRLLISKILGRLRRTFAP
jgi:hypothetical protein